MAPLLARKSMFARVRQLPCSLYVLVSGSLSSPKAVRNDRSPVTVTSAAAYAAIGSARAMAKTMTKTSFALFTFSFSPLRSGAACMWKGERFLGGVYRPGELS